MYVYFNYLYCCSHLRFLKMSLLEVMDHINRFLSNENLVDPDIEADAIGRLYYESGKTKL